MVNGVEENIFLVNAPAGSGKTTWIKNKVQSYLLSNPNDNILCITYTNRAAEELGKDLESERVYFGTIHSFINGFIGSFFSHSEIIDFYWEIYKGQIKKRIENVEQKSNWEESNNRYKEKYGKIDLDTVYENIKSISYNETPFNSLYRGALSHDDLISFTRQAVDKFPVIKKKISDKYQIIFIDEYQDTFADVLHIFYESVLNKKNRLYLLGDKMQQIYRNYNGEFEEQFETFNKDIKLSINYRTTPKIVDILNFIYNDNTLKQIPYEQNSNDEMSFQPQILIVDDIEKTVVEFTEQYNDALVLYLSNKSRFHSIGVGELYDAYDKMDKYKFGRKYSSVDVLTKEEARENDILLSFLIRVHQIVINYQQGYYGEIFRYFRKNQAYFNFEKFTVKVHNDKLAIKRKLEKIVDAYNSQTNSIDEFLNNCLQNGLIKQDYYEEIISDDEYKKVKDVKILEFKLLVEYLENPKVSTQHGVKGESHDTILFVAENGTHNPPVNMSGFFKLWSDVNITLSKFDSFYYQYNNLIHNIENSIGMKCSELKKDTYVEVSSIVEDLIQKFISENYENDYYIHLLKDSMEKYIKKKTVTNAKNCLKESIVYGPLCAYRLFYVGCSRARKNLAIVIKRSDIEEFEEKVYQKFESCGFKVNHVNESIRKD